MIEVNVLTGTFLETNNYIITSKTKAVIIESSCKVSEVKKIVKDREVCGIFLTHGHWDHYLEIIEFEKEFNCKIFLTQEARKKIEETKKAFPADKNPKINLSSCDVDYISNNQILDFGEELKFKVLETPGHTNCSVCYVLEVNDDTLIFCGDLIFNNGIGRTDLPTGNRDDIKKSIKNILQYSDKTVLMPGHGELTTIGMEKENLLTL